MRISEHDVAQKVLSSKGQGGFLLCRFGHCEARVMGFPDFSARTEVDKSLLLQLGYTDLSDEEVAFIAAGIRDAYRASDIVGLTNLDQPRAGIEYLDGLLMKIPKIVESFELGEEEKTVCSADIHVHLLRKDLLPTIIAGFETVCLISCRDLVEDFSQRFARHVYQIFVPQENKTFGISHSVVNSRHFPDQFQLVVNEIKARVRPGTLVLIGAGFLGKIYGTVAKRMGATVIDLGSVFDVWAGVQSRAAINDDLINKYRFASDRRSTFVSETPERQNSVVSVNHRGPVWEARHHTGPIVAFPADDKNQASFSKAGVFIHSSVSQDSRYLLFSDIGVEACALVCVVGVDHRDADDTVISLDVLAADGTLCQLKTVCRGGDKFKFAALLPSASSVDSIKICARPVAGGSTRYGWVWVRQLQLY